MEGQKKKYLPISYLLEEYGYLVYTHINPCFLLFFFITEPFKCGYVFPKATRSLLVHHTTENVTNPANETSPTSFPAENGANYTHNQADSNSFFGLVEPSPTVKEEIVLPEVAGDTRIVNGEDCPPGECPWQVHYIQRNIKS